MECPRNGPETESKEGPGTTIRGHQLQGTDREEEGQQHDPGNAQARSDQTTHTIHGVHTPSTTPSRLTASDSPATST
jgi:hypothetical protein